MKLQSILVMFIVILSLYFGEFLRGCILVWQSLVKKFVVERGFTNIVFLFILVGPNIWIVFLG